MQGLLFTTRGRKRKPSRRRRHPFIWPVVAIVLVAGGVVLAWPLIFGRDNDANGAGTGPMLPGDPVGIRTPEPGAAHMSFMPPSNSGDGSGDSEAGDDEAPETADASGVPPEPTGANAETVVAPAVVDTTPPSTAVATLAAEAELKERRGEIIAARSLYCRALAGKPSAAQRAAIVKQVTAICGRTVLGPRVVEGDPEVELYAVQSGDVLSNIGRRYDIPYELIKRLNGLSSDMIQIDQKLKVVKGPFRVRIVKSTFTLELWLRGILVKTYPVAVGMKDTTPIGTFKVTDKVPAPTFYPPESLRGKMPVIPGGDPKNPLGSRWIRFGGRSLSLGIHGTNEPQSIGKKVSLGCIRMLNADAEFVYDCLSRGAGVEIVE